MESRAAGPAVPRLGRTQRPGRPLRRQRRGPGSVRLAARRGHRGAGHAGGRGAGHAGGRGAGCAGGRGAGCAGGRPGEPLAGKVSLGVLGGNALRAGARRWLGGPQEPSRGGRHAGPGTVVNGWLAAGLLFGGQLRGVYRRGLGGLLRGGLRGRICGGPGFGDVIGLRLARARNHQARRHGPGGHEIFRIIPAEQACLLPIFLRRGTQITIPTRLVTFCIHHRPQSRHISGKCRSVPILTLSRPYGLARGSMLPTESERVQRAIFWGFSGLRGATPGQCHHLAGGWRFPGPG